jgi:predicted O-methyltransferase YrrM
VTKRPTLDEIALREGTDKSSRGHGFADIYEELIGDRREQPLTVLEIGVHEGASLRMWRDYLPNATVVGIDKNEGSAAHAGERISVYVGSQGRTSLLERVAAETGPFDLVVDDGSHLFKAQTTSLEHLWPHLRPGGTYVIEDINTSYMESYGMAWREPDTTVESLKGVVDDVHASCHRQPTTLDDVESIHFHFALCAIRRSRLSAKA